MEDNIMTIAKANKRELGGIHAIPELAPQWKKLDLAEILKKNAAFVSISQNKCMYEKEGGLGHENHRSRGSLPATIRVLEEARKADNFVSFRSEEHTSELQSRGHLVCRLLLEKKKM